MFLGHVWYIGLKSSPSMLSASLQIAVYNHGIFHTYGEREMFKLQLRRQTSAYVGEAWGRWTASVGLLQGIIFVSSKLGLQYLTESDKRALNAYNDILVYVKPTKLMVAEYDWLAWCEGINNWYRQMFWLVFVSGQQDEM